MINNRKISVAIATYNGELHLRAQLKSIATQSRLPDEIIVCDDKSSDATVGMIRSFIHETSIPIHLTVNDRNLGVARNFEKSIGDCRGDVIVLCDQDDLWHPDKLAIIDKQFDDEKVSLVFSDLALIDEEGSLTGRTQWQTLQFNNFNKKQIERGNTFQLLMRYNVITGAAMAFRASLRNVILPIGDGWVHDEWIAFIASMAGRIVPIDKPLTYYRQHEKQQIGSGISGLLQQYRYARQNMDDAYFKILIHRLRVLREHIETLGARYSSHQLTIEQKIAHLDRRLQVRSRSLLRPIGATMELCRGDYHRFGYGVRSYLQDIFL